MYKKILTRFEKLKLRYTFYGGSHFFFSKQEKITNHENPCRGYNE
jgi:hypothetical protein